MEEVCVVKEEQCAEVERMAKLVYSACRSISVRLSVIRHAPLCRLHFWVRGGVNLCPRWKWVIWMVEARIGLI